MRWWGWLIVGVVAGVVVAGVLLVMALWAMADE
jgi:hypothetical protein